MWHFHPLDLHGAYLIDMPAFADTRGTFIKTFHAGALLHKGIEFKLRESYFSLSKKDVIRGMHFQLPPYHHAKMVFCPQGAILDVIVDLRKGSPTYGHYHAEELSADNHKAYYIPEGFAHGFKALTDDAITYYLVSTEYSQEHDTGIRFDSIGLDWEIDKPVISDRDMSFPSLQDFQTPFSV
jgi:dTDP-4-dehydrorhamnose 3,5-epimerase